MAKIFNQITRLFASIRDHVDNFLVDKLASISTQKPAVQQVQENTMAFFHALHSPASTEEQSKTDS